ncbi:peptide-methionine (S)-S-oxide reductase MsrA [Flaviaesturariibacter aridisoli]|uniref:Peptide methionine sulfoxide reductase MsrA n=1 Tax=Flaviaesturariibacter aridisoli TaxID=2545761 RepID=A0A4R4E0Q4_9BACT|nr:peptide-methionine (S)-S-oxide reductase MsrA [Flaviaesturariibacter aridisoli]TCZ69070.1 peptide-methionine (S)-S-oxide reductase [Flaviaesturariibacter aridisoli]
MNHKLFSGILLVLFGALAGCVAETQSNKMSASIYDTTPTTERTDTATFATGCFWCTEAVFEQLKGVLKVTSGYSGGKRPNPTYEEVSSGSTGYAECVQVVYEPDVISYDELLQVFFEVHDPTSLNKQGADEGPQYRSAIFYHDAAQKDKAQYYVTELNKSGAYNKPIVTEVSPFGRFYPAEDYHQDYYQNNKYSNPYCAAVIRPKLEKFQKVFAKKLKN